MSRFRIPAAVSPWHSRPVSHTFRNMHANRDSVAFRSCCRAFAILSLAAIAIPAFAQAGDLDPTFGNGGRVFTQVPAPLEHSPYEYDPLAESMLVQPDGRILVSGRFWEDKLSYWYGTLILRYLSDGSLDPSFGTNGIVENVDSTHPYNGHAVGADMVLQRDGKIVLIGQVPIANGIVVQRYTPTGQLDPTFGNGGTTRVEGRAFGEGTSINIQADGKIVGVGWEYDPYTTPYYDAILLFRLNADGSFDSTFGPAGNGKLFLDHGYDGPIILIQRDGRILVVGNFTPAAIESSSVGASAVAPGGILRFNTDGSPDTSFGKGGRIDFTTNSDFFLITSAALQADGKIVVGFRGGTEPSGLLRFNSDGTLDTRFGTNGMITFESGHFEPVVRVETDGRIIVAGNVPNAAGLTDFAILRFQPDGASDVSFGTAGRAVIPMNAGGTNDAIASTAALQSDGNVLVAGHFMNYYTDSHEKVALVRVLSPVISRRRAVTH